jgi:hypothetical protein
MCDRVPRMVRALISVASSARQDITGGDPRPRCSRSRKPSFWLVPTYSLSAFKGGAATSARSVSREPSISGCGFGGGTSGGGTRLATSTADPSAFHAIDLSLVVSWPNRDQVAPASVDRKKESDYFLISVWSLNKPLEASCEHLHRICRIERDTRLGVLTAFAALALRDSVNHAENERKIRRCRHGPLPFRALWNNLSQPHKHGHYSIVNDL